MGAEEEWNQSIRGSRIRTLRDPVLPALKIRKRDGLPEAFPPGATRWILCRGMDARGPCF